MEALTQKGIQYLNQIETLLDAGGQEDLPEEEIEAFRALAYIQYTGDFPDDISYGIVKQLRNLGFVEVDDAPEDDEELEDFE